MTPFNKLSTKQLAALTDADIDHYVQIELMQRGVVPVPEPVKPPDPTFIPKTVTGYKVTINYIDIGIFPSREIAEAVAAATQGRCLKHDWHYKTGPVNKYLREFVDNPMVEQVQACSEQDILDSLDKLQSMNEAQNAYDIEARQYREYKETIASVRSGIVADVRNACHAIADARLKYDTYKHYLDMCDNNSDIAIKFLFNTYKSDVEGHWDNVNELLDDGKKIPLPAKGMP